MGHKAGSFQTGTGVVGSTVDIPMSFRMAWVKTRWSGANAPADAGPTRATLAEGRGIALENGKNYCWSAWRQDNADPYGAGSGLWNVACVVRQSGPATTAGRGTLAPTATGMRFTVTEQFASDTTVCYEAGSGIQLDAFEVTEPGVAGLVDYPTAFGATLLEVLGSGKAAFNTPSATVQVMLGAASGPSADEQGIWSNYEASAVGNTSGATYCRRTECLAIIDHDNVLTRGRLNGFASSTLSFEWLERSGSRKFVFIIFSGRHFVAQTTTRADLNPWNITGMTWTPEAFEMVSSADGEASQDAVQNDNLQFSDGFALGPTERELCFTRYSFDGNTLGSRQVYMHEFDEVYGNVTVAAAPLVDGLGDVSDAFTADEITLVMDDADPTARYAFLIIHGPPVIQLRARLTKYLHNTIISLMEGRNIIRDPQGRDLPMTEVLPDNYMFSAAFMFPTPVKRHSNIEERHLHFLETLGVSGDQLRAEVERESLFASVMKRLGA